MIKKIVLIVFLLMAPFLNGAKLTTPLKNTKNQQAIILNSFSPEKFFSPEKPRIVFDKFRILLIKTLEENNIKNFHDTFKTYFRTFVYPMQVKNKKFYASLFYAIFQEIAHQAVFHESTKEGFEKITIFIQTQNNHFFAFEVFIYDTQEDEEDSDDESQEPLITPDSINETYNYGFVNADQPTEKVQTIRMFLNIANHRKLIIDALDTSETKRFKIIKAKNWMQLDTKAKSPVHRIIHELDRQNPNFNLIQENLEFFYNSLPHNLTRPFREKKCEKFYHALFYATLNFLRFNYASTECYTCEGRIDILINSTVPGQKINRPVIIEFKHKSRAKTALNQIRERGYLKGISHSNECKPLMVGINIKTSDQTKKITVSKIAFEEYEDNITPLRQTKIQSRPIPVLGQLDFTNCK